MNIRRRRNGNLIIELEINDSVEIRGASIDVTLAEASNTSMLPKNAEDVDAIVVSGTRRRGEQRGRWDTGGF